MVIFWRASKADEVRRTPGAPTAFLHDHVEAQNSFGATLRTRFICKMTQEGSCWTVAVAFDEPESGLDRRQAGHRDQDGWPPIAQRGENGKRPPRDRKGLPAQLCAET